MSAIAFDDDIDRDTTDPGIVPGGIRDRAMSAVLRRGPKDEEEEKTRASQEYWAALKGQRKTERANLKRSDQHDQANN
jgi:hypothetical protein